MCIESILYSCCVAKVNENFEDGMLFGSSHVKSCVSLASTYTKKGMVPSTMPLVFSTDCLKVRGCKF